MDGILRNREEHFTSIFDGKDVPRQIAWMLGIIVGLSAFYGLVMGTLSGIPDGIPQMISSAIKVPVLYLLTLFVCYPVLFVVNVVMGSKLGFSGLWAMVGLWKGLQAMCEHSELYPKQAIKILQVWILVFAFVGLQMTWTLRPFIGASGLEFEIFRAHSEGNIYVTILQSAAKLAQGVID